MVVYRTVSFGSLLKSSVTWFKKICSDQPVIVLSFVLGGLGEENKETVF